MAKKSFNPPVRNNYVGMRKAILFFFILIGLQGYSQTKADSSKQKNSALNVFLDCAYCDLDYLRTEISIVNYVRDRAEADVDIVASTIQTGSGGQEFTFVFVGQGKFAGQRDTLKTNATSFATDDGQRKAILQTLKLGLTRYIAKTPLADKLNITFTKDTAKADVQLNVAPALDKWKSWVFTASIYGNLNKQQLTQQVFGYPSISISKVTPDWKIGINYSVFYQNNVYVESDSLTLKTILRTENFNINYTKSLGEHFSAGFLGTVASSTPYNYNLQTKGGPAVEYSLFPYSECTHRQIRFLYALYGVDNDYVDTTIYDKIKEKLLGQSFTIYSQYKQQWGSLTAQVTGEQYVNEPTKYEVDMTLSLTFNLFEGFSISVYSSGSIIHDQIYLPAGGPTTPDILLGLQTLATTYQFSTGIQFTYTFGSIYNNIVNPRFNLLLPEE